MSIKFGNNKEVKTKNGVRRASKRPFAAPFPMGSILPGSKGNTRKGRTTVPLPFALRIQGSGRERELNQWFVFDSSYA